MADPIDPRRRSLRTLAGMGAIALLVVACTSSGSSVAPSVAAPSAAAPSEAAPSEAAVLGETTLGSGNDRVKWPHRDRLNWPHPRPAVAGR